MNGKIYRISNLSNTKCYIGSTTKSIELRFTQHKNAYTGYKNGVNKKVMVYELFDEFQVENCIISLVEDFKCDTIQQLHKREGEIMKNHHNRINHNIAGRKLNEYYQDNKKMIKGKIMNYRNTHLEEYKAYQKVYQKNYRNKRKIEYYANKIATIILNSKMIVN